MKEALKMALEALEEIALAGMSPSPEMIDNKEAFHAHQAWRFIGIAARALEPIKEALAQQSAERVNPQGVSNEQVEPVAFIDMREWPPIRWRDGMVRADVAPFDGQGLFFSPPQRPSRSDMTWIGLTDDEIALINADYPHPQGFAKALQAKFKEKNA